MTDTVSAPSATRTETDSMGPIEVPADHYWGAQTQRSLHFFADRRRHDAAPSHPGVRDAQARGGGRQPRAGPAARREATSSIVAAADEVADGQLAGEFPLRVWQTGSGTQSNMNVNEVIAGRANELATGARGGKKPIHPNDDVNMSQSSQRHVPDRAAHGGGDGDLGAAHPVGPRAPRRARRQGAASGRRIVKIGRTHLQDAVPLTLGQEFSGYVAQLDGDIARLEAVLPGLHEIALGGTAVGTGLNAHPEFAERVAARIAELTGQPFSRAPNKFAALAGQEATVFASGALRTLATQPDEDRERHPLAGLGAAGRPRRAAAARERARLLDHARQGEPDPERDAHDGRDPGLRLRHGDRVRRQPGQLRAQRVQAGHRPTTCSTRSSC